MQAYYQQIVDFLSKNVSREGLQKVSLSFLIIFGVVVAQLIIGSVVSVVDSVPVFNGLMELIGLVVVLRFCKNTLLVDEKRKELIESLKLRVSEFN